MMNHLKFTRLLDTDYEKTIQGLNEEQHDVFNTVQQYFRYLHKFNLGEHSKPESLHLYVSGPGGIGTLNLFLVIHQLLLYCSNRVAGIL